MIIGRNKELSQLANYYSREKSQILVLYGAKYLGKTSLMREFIQDKPSFYFGCEECSEREQLYRMGLRLAEYGIKTLKYPEFNDVFSAILSTKHTQKKVIVFDEFHHILKNCPTFFDSLISFIHDSWNKQEYLIVLSSSAVEFIENSMVSKIGEAAFELSGFMKLRPLEFKHLKEFFPKYSTEDCLVTWALLGGVPGLWQMFDQKLSVRDNIVRNILSQKGSLNFVALHSVDMELRETGVYNTILSALSEGKNKLNDLYEHTGFSRAKISVYIKNLMELEFVDKIYSLETDGHENTQKGLYKVSNHIVDFYYTFIYRHFSAYSSSSAEDFYVTFVQPVLKTFVSKYFKDICKEYLADLADEEALPVNPTRYGTWVGKQGTIDVVASDDDGKNILAVCVYDKPMITYDDYSWLLFTASKAKLSDDYVYLFSAARFDEKLTLEGKIRKNIKLILLDQM